MSDTLQPQIFQFLKQVKQNNNREWFNANKPTYQSAYDNFKAFANSLIAFDRLGRLFIATGDGADGRPGPDAPSRNAMSLANPYGKILRIDPLGDDSPNGKYGVPRRNPFVVIDHALREIWCYGLRDPRRIEFDPFRDWLSIVDVGQGDIEEVNISEIGGGHFGWDLCEGSYFYPPSEGGKPTEGVTGPRAEFAQAPDRRVAGGFVYRGESLAIDLITQRFAKSFFSEDTYKLADQVNSIVQALEHRPLHPESEAFQRFQEQTQGKITKLQEQYPFLDFS